MAQSAWTVLLSVLLLIGSAAAEEEPLDVLLADYKQFGLPLPPDKAKLARFMSGANLLTGKKFFRLGFVLPPEKEGGQQRRFSVFRTSEVQAGNAERIEPIAASFEGTALSQSFDMAESFYQDHTLLFAIQCHARGWRELALKAYEPYSRDLKFLRRMLGMWAWDAAVDRLRDPQFERSVVVGQLKACREASLTDKNQRRPTLIDDLEKTVRAVPSDTEEGKWIEQLLEVTYVRREVRDTVSKLDAKWGYHPVYAKALGQWFKRMPLLLEYVDDTRITRCAAPECSPYRDDFSSSTHLHPGTPPARLGELVKRIIMDVAGQDFESRGRNGFSQAAAKAWWVKTKDTGEEAYLVQNTVGSGPRKALSVNASLLFLLVTRHPNRFPDLYRKCLREDIKGGLADLAMAVRHVPLDEAARTELWIEGTKSRVFMMRSYALQELFKAKHPDAVSFFLEELRRHPPTPPEDYWTCSPPYLFGVLRWTEDDVAWRAFLNFTKESDIGQRAQIIGHVSYTYLEERALAKRVAFAAFFLDDHAVCDPKSGGKYRGVPAAAFLGKTTIRNLAALRLGSLLKQKPYPKPKWTTKQWDDYIQKLKADERLQRAEIAPLPK